MLPARNGRAAPVRTRIRVGGQVQGVGFRPFVHRLATELDLSGWVRNGPAGVEIEVQGPEAGVTALLARLEGEAPPLARIERVQCEPLAPAAAGGFVIRDSGAGRAATGITPDSAVCRDCLAELFDPGGHRYRHAFINCTQCGPRYTLTARLPYDRAHTSMARFALCARCRQEYAAPENRRFHAQPNCCPDCGPRLALLGAGGEPMAGDPVAGALECIGRGGIVAIKGLGGFHLACDARDAAAVARLRERKQREEKPLAVMAANAGSLSRWAEIAAAARALLEAPERPIVLLRKLPGADAALAGVAPGLAWLGALLPYAPLHYLLFHEAAGRPAGTAWLGEPQELALVMTSANPGGEPLVTGNDEALARLAGIADAFLLHDRDILLRCDDSVAFAADPVAQGQSTPQLHFVRRARGYTPRAIRLPAAGPAALALGGHFKATVCLTRGDEAFLSQHIGDLDNAPACRALEEAARHLMQVLEIAPEVLAHDLHPDFHSTRLAAELARERGLPLIGVQHHHAHIAALLAEHGAAGPALGLALDGVGLGSDGGIWGGELLLADGARCERLAHLAPLLLPGGDRAAREPWRMAAAALFALGRADEIERRFPGPRAFALRQMLESGVHAPPTSSCGRLFDAAAGLLGVRLLQSFEGQAPMLLEGLAERHGPAPALEGGWRIGPDGALDFLPLLEFVASGAEAGRAAAVFHATLAQGLAQWALRAARARGLGRIALGGGCLLNRVLAAALRAELARAGIEVLEARQAPPNDGGLSLGQAWVAMNSRVA